MSPYYGLGTVSIEDSHSTFLHRPVFHEERQTHNPIHHLSLTEVVTSAA